MQGSNTELSKRNLSNDRIRDLEERMFRVSEKAKERIKEFFKDREEASPIRLILSGSG